MGRAEKRYLRENRCCFCDEKSKPSDIKVRERCRLTGKQRAAAHQRCNLKAISCFWIMSVILSTSIFRQDRVFEFLWPRKKSISKVLQKNVKALIGLFRARRY